MGKVEHLSSAINYKADEIPEYRYLKARDEWDNRIGSVVVSAKNWRVIGVMSLGLSLLLSMGVIYQTSLNKIVPMVIALDRISGEPKIIGKVTEIGYQPQIAEIKYFLSSFVWKIRTVSKDPVLIKQNWLEAYKFMRPRAAQILNEMTNRDIQSPLKKIGERTVLVEIISITKVGDGNSYQVRWQESEYSANGGLEDRYNMSGVFSVEFDTPEDEGTLAINPLGLFVSGFEWGRELTLSG